MYIIFPRRDSPHVSILHMAEHMVAYGLPFFIYGHYSSMCIES